MNLLCHPCQIDYDYYIDLERPTATEDSNAVLEAIKAPDWLCITKENPSGNETRQSFFSQLIHKQFHKQLQRCIRMILKSLVINLQNRP